MADYTVFRDSIKAQVEAVVNEGALAAVLASEGASSWKRKLMYAAVVVGGWRAYRTDQARGPRIFR